MSEKAWVIMHPKSGMLHFTLRSTKKAAKEELCHNYCICWDEAKSDGYYTQKVIVGEFTKVKLEAPKTKLGMGKAGKFITDILKEEMGEQEQAYMIKQSVFRILYYLKTHGLVEATKVKK